MIQRVVDHPCTVDDFADLIRDRSTRYYKTKRMRERGLLPFVGYYQQPNGRPLDVFCKWIPNSIPHEIKLTKALLAVTRTEPLRVERGPNVDSRYRADADLFFPGGDIWRIEMDTGSQNYYQVENRWKVYEKCEDLVLVITCRRNIDGLMQRAKRYAEFMHFCYWKDIVADPWGDVLFDLAGERYSLKLSMNVTD